MPIKLNDMEIENVIPPGYRELERNEIVLGDDVIFDIKYKQFWGWLEKDLAYPAAGHEYLLPHHYKKFRLINKNGTKENKMETKYHYFTMAGGEGWNKNTSRFMACGENIGYLFTIDGELYNKDKTYSLEYATENAKNKEWVEITLKQALKLINKDGHNKIYEFLGMEKLEPEKPITPEEISKIYDELKTNKAFNADSAYKCSEKLYDIYEEMLGKNLIGKYCGRFYLLKEKPTEIKEGAKQKRKRLTKLEMAKAKENNEGKVLADIFEAGLKEVWNDSDDLKPPPF